jgi:beta-alanine degradation protein BauB
MAFRCDIPAVPTQQRDDDDARITRWDFAPGAVTGFHRHAWPYFVIMLTDGVLRVDADGTVTDNPLVKGQSYQRPAGIEHDVMNGSPHPIAFVEIEVKRAGGLVFDGQTLDTHGA